MSIAIREVVLQIQKRQSYVPARIVFGRGKIDMIKVWKCNMAGKDKFYQVKIIYDGNKIKDTTCECTWSQIHKKAWKNSEVLCKHIITALCIMGLEIKNGRIKEN